MQNLFFRHLNNLLQIREPRLHVLIYHRVMPEPDPLRPWEIDQRQFHEHMRWISGVFRVIPLSQAVSELDAGTLKRRSLAITFDDGYLDNTTHALPILQSFDFPATFFCTSAWLDGGLMWNDQVIEAVRQWPGDALSIPELQQDPFPVATIEQKNQAIQAILPKLKYRNHAERQAIADRLSNRPEIRLPELMMRPEHLRSLAENGMDIGGHTHSHPILAQMDDAEASDELAHNKQTLEKIINQPLNHFAYPNGKPLTDFLPKHQQMVSELGYRCALSTQPGLADRSTHRYEIPRFTPWDKTPNKFLARLTRMAIG